jgi:branched-subunit amino acid ABC-type transport system permease component
MASDILIDAFVVIVVGGFGSLGGAMLSSIIIGELQSFGVLLFPSLALALVYLLMAIVLIVKPSGLFGGEQS